MTKGIASAPRREDRKADSPSRRRLLLWWLHGAVRFVLAALLIYNGVIKLGLGQFGAPDIGESLITLGEMSPMGLLSRMVGFSPLFQVLAGVAEVGAAAALIWRRTALFGGLVTVASMSFIFVLNLGYDMPGKQLSIFMLVLALIVIAPWGLRTVSAIVGSGGLQAPRRPRLFRGERANTMAGIVAPIAGWLVLLLFSAAIAATQPTHSTDSSAPAGVWTVETSDSQEEGADDQRWQTIALGDRLTDGRAKVQVRQTDGTLLTGTYARHDDTLDLELKPLRQPGQTALAYANEPALRQSVTYAPSGSSQMTFAGDQTASARLDHDATVLYERGFSWGIRSDDPFER